jgi:HlyD family secretion protein
VKPDNNPAEKQLVVLTTPKSQPPLPGDTFLAERKAESLRRHVGWGRGRLIRKWLFRLGVLAVLLGVAAAVWYWRSSQQADAGPRYVTRPLRRGDLSATVSATGTLSGRDTVEVGAEVSGTIRTISVDFNDRVEKGQLLCELDPAQLTAARDQARAKLAAARASLASAEATAKETRVEAERSQAMAKEGLVSDQALQASLAAAERAEAAVKSTAAEIALSQASLKSAQTSLDKVQIRSPIDGIVLSRNVEAGQTVAASMTTPVLFVLAKDLTQMELTVAVDEADIGRVHEGQKATFTVDTYPDRKFSAVLKSLHNLPTTTENVVTYEAVLTVANDDLLLRPGMTATATIVTEYRQNALLLPNAALRFSPPQRSERGPRMPLMGPPGRGPRSAGSAERTRGPQGPAVWVLDGPEPRRVAVQTGLSDGQYTEVLKGLDDGAEVIVDMIEGG